MSDVAIIGAGPAGLMAAEVLSSRGIQVTVYDAMPSVGRKFLLAGIGGMNITHSEALPEFLSRYEPCSPILTECVRRFDNRAVVAWIAALGLQTFVGSSGRVFPTDMKAAPLLRAWLARLKSAGVVFEMRHRWTGWDESGALCFSTPAGERRIQPVATVLALGGASWPQLGSDGAWVTTLAERGIDIAPLRPSNCGFDIGWSAHLAGKHAGAPLKPVIAHWQDPDGAMHALQGECVLTATGIEGSVIYAISADLRECILRDGETTLWLDLAPGRDEERLRQDLDKPRGKRSLGEHVRRQTGLDSAKVALLHEVLPREAMIDTARVADTIKRLPLKVRSARPVAEAISTAGGVRLETLDDSLQSKAVPGVFFAGEMLDWEAPTGGYLLTACFASGLIAGRGAAEYALSLR